MEEIKIFLLDKGLKPNLIGFDYISKAIELIVYDKMPTNKITRILYPKIAKIMNVSSNSVNRAIDYCIKSSGFKITASQMIIFYSIIFKKENLKKGV